MENSTLSKKELSHLIWIRLLDHFHGDVAYSAIFFTDAGARHIRQLFTLNIKKTEKREKKETSVRF